MKFSFLIVAFVILFRLMAPAAEDPAPRQPPTTFGIGFTNVTDSSARLVFTTSEPVRSTVVVSSQGREITRLPDETYDEIHAVNLTDLTKGEEYQVVVNSVTHDGRISTSEIANLKPALRPASNPAWPGYTIFGTSISGHSNADLDLLAESGVGLERIEASWSGLYPHDHQLNRAYLDQLLQQIADLKKRNIEPLVVLDYCTAWAKPLTGATMTWRNPAFGPPDRLQDWNEYLHTVVNAFRGSVKYYEIWNEPDAGYLATGSYVERPGLPAPIGRPPFKDNWHYWLGDRFVPMIAEVRRVMDELQPDATVMNGGWNRDYGGQRGDLLLECGAGPDLNAYAFHCYASMPMSFARWYSAIDGGFRTNIDRIFDKHHVRMPLAVTEWGWPAWDDPQPGKGFVSFTDAQKFLVKSTFYFLGQQRVEILSQFCLGIGPSTRDKDPSFYTLVDREPDGKLVKRPSYATFQWVAKTFGSRPYRSLPLKVTPSDQVKAYAIHLTNSDDTYLAVWQDGVPDEKGNITAQPAREVEVSIPDLSNGFFEIQSIGLDGSPRGSAETTTKASFPLKVTLPEISATEESGIYLVRIKTAKK